MEVAYKSASKITKHTLYFTITVSNGASVAYEDFEVNFYNANAS